MPVDDLRSGTWVTYVGGRATGLRLRRCRVEVTAGPDAGLIRDLEAPVIRVGARRGNDVQLSDAKVSGLHCEIRLDDRGYRLRDLDSTNGTFVGGIRINDVYIQPGAQIAVGSTRLKFEPLGESVELEISERDRLGGMLGRSVKMRELFARLQKLAATDTTVLITGETGVGKELAAECVHDLSPRAKGPFVVVDCGSIPPTLIESELFGHERGAFTGAVAKKRGLFEVADGGTIFLDEIGDMTLAAQAKVLRVLQTGEFTRVGGEKSLRTDSRVVAATNRDLEEMVKAGTFREDLYFRLNVVPIRSPDLAERADDVPLLVEAFVAECCQDNGFAVKPIDDVVFDRLKAYDWPGNVRELRNVVERLVIMSDEVIRERDLPPYLGGPRAAVGRQTGPIPAFTLDKYAGKSLREFREEIESEFIRMKLAELNWNISKTAQVLGIERTNLHKKLRALGIHRADDGKDE